MRREYTERNVVCGGHSGSGLCDLMRIPYLFEAGSIKLKKPKRIVRLERNDVRRVSNHRRALLSLRLPNSYLPAFGRGCLLAGQGCRDRVHPWRGGPLYLLALLISRVGCR